MTSGISKLRPHETKDEPLREEKTVRLAQRNSFQTGSCKPKRWKNGDKGYAICYRVRDPNSETGWRYKRENLRGMSHKQAKKILAERLNEVNATNNNPGQHAPSMTFADFTSGLWKNYLGNRRIKARGSGTGDGRDKQLDNRAGLEGGEKKSGGGQEEVQCISA